MSVPWWYVDLPSLRHWSKQFTVNPIEFVCCLFPIENWRLKANINSEIACDVNYNVTIATWQPAFGAVCVNFICMQRRDHFIDFVFCTVSSHTSKYISPPGRWKNELLRHSQEPRVSLHPFNKGIDNHQRFHPNAQDSISRNCIQMSTEAPFTRNSTFSERCLPFLPRLHSMQIVCYLSLLLAVNSLWVECSTNVCTNLKIHYNKCSAAREQLIRFSPVIFPQESVGAHASAHSSVLVPVCILCTVRTHSLPLFVCPFFLLWFVLRTKCLCAPMLFEFVFVCAFMRLIPRVCVYVWAGLCLSFFEHCNTHKCYAVHGTVVIDTNDKGGGWLMGKIHHRYMRLRISFNRSKRRSFHTPQFFPIVDEISVSLSTNRAKKTIAYRISDIKIHIIFIPFCSHRCANRKKKKWKKL